MAGRGVVGGERPGGRARWAWRAWFAPVHTRRQIGRQRREGQRNGGASDGDRSTPGKKRNCRCERELVPALKRQANTDSASEIR